MRTGGAIQKHHCQSGQKGERERVDEGTSSCWLPGCCPFFSFLFLLSKVCLMPASGSLEARESVVGRAGRHDGGQKHVWNAEKKFPEKDKFPGKI
jgi:hypothetical protein